jgi:hypothetical protein
MSTRDSEKILAQLNAVLEAEFSIAHTTIQVESALPTGATDLHPVPTARNDS